MSKLNIDILLLKLGEVFNGNRILSEDCQISHDSSVPVVYGSKKLKIGSCAITKESKELIGEFDILDEYKEKVNGSKVNVDYDIEDSGTNVLNGLVIINRIKLNKIVVNGKED